MLQVLLIRLTTLCILMSLCIASSYEEKTVYTQALLTVSYFKGGKKPDPTKVAGKYAKRSGKQQVEGVLYFSNTINWCDEKSAKKYKFPKEKWIALIPRQQTEPNKTCTLSLKLLTAKKMNASGVVVYNSIPGEVPAIEDDTRDVITVMIDREAGNELRKLVLDSSITDIKCKVTVGTHYVDRRWKVSRTSVLFVLVSFILLMCISLAWLVFYYVQRFRHIYRNDRKEKQLLSAAKKAISKLKTRGYQESPKEDLEESCAVCLECYKEGETLRILPCKHEFHKACIDPWLLNHRTCPMCKSNILKSLGVEMPENETNGSDDRYVRGFVPPSTTTIEASQSNNGEPSVVVVVHEQQQVPQAWAEPSIAQPSPDNRYSASSSSSDTDSDRSTVALVSFEQRV
ncbi:RING finger protein 150-like [Clytia hemisphaerica]|uniref:RING-type domain-containing protein n=1 Tax=Clytia hemisphaerica TaxID=252671 RepID=A0A7M5WWS1_9CNID|eukprot:TCONS_00048998-protein